MAAALILLDRSSIQELMSVADYLGAVETAFDAVYLGRALSPPPMHLKAGLGGFHAKGAILRNGRSYAAVKVNGNFPSNGEKYGLPTIQGAVILCDGENGTLLSIMDSIEITLRRTAAASALAARHLARPDSAILAICGCGEQGRVQAEALAALFPIRSVHVWDIDPDKAAAFTARMSQALGIPFASRPSAAEAVQDADMIVTCTTSRVPFLEAAHVRPGTFIAAVGADSPDKSEIAPDLMKRSRVAVDSLEQCLAMGDLRHAVEAGAMTSTQVEAELAEIVAGAKAGRRHADDIVIFDSTGTALQDVASAARIYERAAEMNLGLRFVLG